MTLNHQCLRMTWSGDKLQHVLDYTSMASPNVQHWSELWEYLLWSVPVLNLEPCFLCNWNKTASILGAVWILCNCYSNNMQSRMLWLQWPIFAFHIHAKQTIWGTLNLSFKCFHSNLFPLCTFIHPNQLDSQPHCRDARVLWYQWFAYKSHTLRLSLYSQGLWASRCTIALLHIPNKHHPWP